MAPHYKIENQLSDSLWMQNAPKVRPPWEFFANLNPKDAKSMRRIAEHLILSLYSQDDKASHLEAFMTDTEIFEVQRMGDEANGREDRIHGRKNDKWRAESPVEMMNTLMFKVLEWFGDGKDESDAEVLRRAAKASSFIDISVRQPNDYKVEYEAADDEWELFVEDEKAKAAKEAEKAQEALEAQEAEDARLAKIAEDEASGYADINQRPVLGNYTIWETIPRGRGRHVQERQFDDEYQDPLGFGFIGRGQFAAAYLPPTGGLMGQSSFDAAYGPPTGGLMGQGGQEPRRLNQPPDMRHLQIASTPDHTFDADILSGLNYGYPGAQRLSWDVDMASDDRTDRFHFHETEGGNSFLSGYDAETESGTTRSGRRKRKRVVDSPSSSGSAESVVRTYYINLNVSRF